MTQNLLPKKWRKLAAKLTSFPDRQRVPQPVLLMWDMVSEQMSGSATTSEESDSLFWLQYFEAINSSHAKNFSTLTATQLIFVNFALAELMAGGAPRLTTEINVELAESALECALRNRGRL